MKRTTTAIALLLLMMPAGAQAQDLPAQLTACLAIPGVLQRLACYDRVAHGISPRNVPAQRPAASAPMAYVPPVASAAAPIPATAPAPGLGSERLPRQASAPSRRPQELLAGVASLRYDARGRFTITLDNGQVWRQLEGDTAVLTGARISEVRISHGALGSYDLNVVGRNATYRVTRLQ